MKKRLLFSTLLTVGMVSAAAAQDFSNPTITVFASKTAIAAAAGTGTAGNASPQQIAVLGSTMYVINDPGSATGEDGSLLTFPLAGGAGTLVALESAMRTDAGLDGSDIDYDGGDVMSDGTYVFDEHDGGNSLVKVDGSGTASAVATTAIEGSINGILDEANNRWITGMTTGFGAAEDGIQMFDLTSGAPTTGATQVQVFAATGGTDSNLTLARNTNAAGRVVFWDDSVTAGATDKMYEVSNLGASPTITEINASVTFPQQNVGVNRAGLTAMTFDSAGNLYFFNGFPGTGTKYIGVVRASDGQVFTVTSAAIQAVTGAAVGDSPSEASLVVVENGTGNAADLYFCDGFSTSGTSGVIKIAFPDNSAVNDWELY